VEQLSNLELELWTQVNLMIFYQIYFLPKYKIVKLKKKNKNKNKKESRRVSLVAQRALSFFFKKIKNKN
jgi:hypothetical protein